VAGLIEDTSRSPRPGEQNGREYHFVSRKEFEKLISEDKFIEHTQCITTQYLAESSLLKLLWYDYRSRGSRHTNRQEMYIGY